MTTYELIGILWKTFDGIQSVNIKHQDVFMSGRRVLKLTIYKSIPDSVEVTFDDQDGDDYESDLAFEPETFSQEIRLSKTATRDIIIGIFDGEAVII